MLDIKFIREFSDILKKAALKKKIKVNIDKLIKLDDDRLAMLARVEDMRSKQNTVSEEIVRITDPAMRQEKISAMQDLKILLKKEESRLKETTDAWQEIMWQIPNIPDMSVPEGAGEEDNVPVHQWGEVPQFDFPIKDHRDLMLDLGMVDFERGTKVHGFRGYFLRGAGAELSWALWNYARDFFSSKNFVPVIAPAIVRKQNFYGTGHLPAEAEDLYVTQDDDYLSGTAEVSMMGYHSGEVLSMQDLPGRYLSFSPCYRREAGSHGKDTKGLIRVHEFFKLEQLILCEANHQQSDTFFEEINRNHEEFIESLGIPYHRLLICAGDLSASKVKQYDTEVWMPSEHAYRETSSASYFHDYQTRRFNIRYKDDVGKLHFAHSLNCTAAATPRLLAAVVENSQQEDGSLKIPLVLQSYMKTDIISKGE
ncbi:MAG: seryl-tRNA synthetase [Planctomycetota bacterium]|jgi:seryl-tRNA synthetase